MTFDDLIFEYLGHLLPRKNSETNQISVLIRNCSISTLKLTMCWPLMTFDDLDFTNRWPQMTYGNSAVQ